MRTWGVIGALAIALVACRTHTVDDCRPACDASNQMFFATCVASGNAMPFCEAGNRRCCALAADCVGQLDDQTVQTTQTNCMALHSDQCWPPCDVTNDQSYARCLSDGAASCAAGDEACCALAQDCLGDLGDVTVSADGCCATQMDCPSPTVCDPMFWTCMGGRANCGNGTIDAGEDCDDHNTVTESCTYGLMSCMVCDASCHSVAGAASFCGDHTIDLTDGETCDPPNTLLDTCDASCHSPHPASCTNGVRDGMETDIDCGGPECAGCLPGGQCSSPSDCRGAHTADCGSTTDCVTPLTCTEMSRCSDTDPCTDDGCDAAGGCTHAPLDYDGDGMGPGTIGCGSDCNDRNATVFLDAPEICDGIDNDCDETVDEACTPAH